MCNQLMWCVGFAVYIISFVNISLSCVQGGFFSRFAPFWKKKFKLKIKHRRLDGVKNKCVKEQTSNAIRLVRFYSI